VSHERFQRIAVVGLGLLGGSLVQSIRRIMPERTLIGVDYPEVLERARTFLDEAHTPAQLAIAVRKADLVFLATPISIILQTLPTVANMVPHGAVVTDVGSTKRVVAELAQNCFAGERFFIGGHPMAGREKGGWENATDRLFESSAYVLTPSPNFPAAPLTALQDLLRTLGAHTMLLEAEEHDRIAAEISHMPLLLALALTNFIARPGVASEPRVQMAAGGFRDMTRIAASPFAIWRDILHTNHANVRHALQEFILTLQQLAQDLEREELDATFQHAHELRQKLLRS